MKTAEDKNGKELAERDAAAERCILKLKSGDLDALSELYSLASTPVYSYSLSLLGNRHDAEDALHDCIVKIFASAKSYRPQGKPMAWIIRIARNLCLERIRKRKRENTVSLDSEELELPVYPVAEEEDRLMVEGFMRVLSEEERTIIVLHLTAGFTFREIAKEIKMPSATVMTKYRRALIKIRKQFE